MKQKKSRTQKRKPTQSKKVVFPLVYVRESGRKSKDEDHAQPLILAQEVLEHAPFALADTPRLQLP